MNHGGIKMPRYKDFKSYIQANYEKNLNQEILKFVKKSYDGLGFHSINVTSLCENKIENVNINFITCRDDIGPLIQIDIHVSAEVVALGLGTTKYDADRKTRWFTVYVQAVLKDGLHDVKFLRTEEFKKERFKKDGALDEYLVPYMYADDLEDEADDFFEFYCKDAICDECKLPIDHILSQMGVEYYEAPLPDNIFGRMYFRPSKVEVYENFNSYISDSLKKKDIKPGTMLISKTRRFMDNVGSWMETIAHEFVHWEKHQKFFEILALLNHEEENLSCDVHPHTNPDKLEGVKKAIWWAEWQANALAPRILMPRALFVDLFEQIYKKEIKTPYLYIGQVMERSIERIARYFGVSKYSAKYRALQLGYKTAEGAFRYIDGKYCSPYTFNQNALKDYRTFIIGRRNFEKLFLNNDHFNELIDTGKFVYVGGVVCINDPLYVSQINGDNDSTEYELTVYALEHIDECCLIFKRNYNMVDSAGDYYNQCYLNRDLNAEEFSESKEIDEEDNQSVEKQEEELRKLVAECERITELRDGFPSSFHGTLDANMKRLKKPNGRRMTNEELQFRTGISSRYIQDLRKKHMNISREVVYAICIGLHLHPILSEDLIQKAKLDFLPTPEGYFAKHLINNHFKDSLKLCNNRLEKAGFKRWGDDSKILEELVEVIS